MLPAVAFVFTFNVANALFILAIVPVNTKRVLLPVKLNPDAGVRPVVVLMLNVVPAGACGKPIAQSKVAVELNPLKENPLASWLGVLIANDLGSGAVTDCPNPKIVTKDNKSVNNILIIQLPVPPSYH
jgi:hypothetical protein